MKISPWLLTGSLAVNVALLALLVAGTLVPPPAAPVVPPAPSTPTAANLALTPERWHRLYSDDLPTLIARLRAEGFPADRISAMVGAHVHQRFAARRQALDAAEANVPYWRTPAYSSKSPARRALDREERDLLRSVLGTDAQDLSQLQRQFPGFSPEKSARLVQLDQDYNDRRNELSFPDNSLGTAPLPDVPEKLAALERDYRARLAAVLTPQELADYELRASNTADTLRDDLAAFHPSEQEFRTIFALQRALDLEYDTTWGPVSPEQRRIRDEAEEKLNASLRAALGDARFADYERSSDFDYQKTSALVARLSLPSETADQVWTTQRDLEQRAGKLRADRSLATEERNRQLAALADEAKSKLTAALGPRGFDTYRQSLGVRWLPRLEPLPNRSPTQ